MLKFSKYVGWVGLAPYNLWLIIIVGLLGLVSLFAIPKLQFSFEMNDFFPDNADSALQYSFFEEEVGSIQYNYMISLAPKDHQWDQEFVEEFQMINQVLDEELETFSTFSILDIVGANSISGFELFGQHSKTKKLLQEKQSWVNDPRFSTFLFSKNGQAAILYLQQDQTMDINDAVESLQVLETIKENHPDLMIKWMGTGYLHQMVEKIQTKEISAFSLISLLITFLFSYFLFNKNLRLVVISILSLGLMFILLAGLLVLFRIPLNLLMSLLPIVLLIVGTADIVHFFTKYQFERSKTTNANAIKHSISDIGFATFLTSITSAFAFIALTFNSIPAIRNFGIAAAMGVLIAYLVLLFFTVPLLSLFMNGAFRTPITKRRFDVSKLYSFGKDNKKFVISSSFVLLIMAIIGITLIKYDFEPESVLPNKYGVYDNFQHFEDQLDGIRPVEIYVSNQDKNIHDYEVMKDIQEVEQFLTDSLNLGISLSPTYAYKLLNSMYQKNNEDFHLPPNKKTWKLMDQTIQRVQKNKGFGGKFYNSDSTYTRILSNMKSGSSKESAYTIGLINDKLSTINQNSGLHFQLQGFADLVDQNVDFIRRNMIYGLAISLLLVCLLISLVFQKPWLIIASFIPNILPLLFTAAVIGFLQINFDSTLTMIFAVLFGLVVDDSIHFLSKYRLERSKGVDVEEALKITIKESGKAIVYTSILIFAGLLVSLSSSFYPTRMIGVLMGVTILFALYCDLLLLPFLLRRLDRN